MTEKKKELSYETWLNGVFGGTKSRDPNIDVEATLFAELFEQTLVQSGTDLLRFSDKQVNRGLWNLLATTGFVWKLHDVTIPVELRISSVLAIKKLYRDCFMQRAKPVLCHCGDVGRSPLNSICFMLWDVTPIDAWGKMEGHPYYSYFDLALEVMEYALNLPHIACVESALHGLGHLGGDSKRVHAVIDRWRERGIGSRPELAAYAEKAYEGLVI